MDEWSDLDVVITSPTVFDVEAAPQDPLWAFQSTDEADAQFERAVLVDRRRVDAVISGGAGLMLLPPVDSNVRVDGVLAAVRPGRGNNLCRRGG